jgi:ribonuclease HI
VIGGYLRVLLSQLTNNKLIMKKLFIYSDGGARGNPGPAAIGYIIKDASGKTLAQAGLVIGVATNNVAEYKAIICALQAAASFKDFKEFEIQAFLDSKLVVEQLLGNWKIKKPHLVGLSVQVKRLERNFEKVEYRHIPREKNTAADALLNKALDSC